MRRSLSAPAGRGPVHAGRRGSFAPAGVARVRPARAPRPAGADHRRPNERATRLLHTRIPSGHYGGGRRTQLRHRADSRCCLEDLQKMGRIAASRRQTREPGPHRADGPLHQCLLAFSVQSAGLCFRAPRYRRWDRVPRAPMSGGRLFPSAQRTDLCVGTWCNLDYALAELWGGKLGRTTTLVEGYDRCNFHFKAVR